MRDFVTKYEQGFRQASQLVSSEALQVREIIVRESGKTEKAMRDHVTRTSANFERKLEYRIEQTSVKRHHERLLTSLKYRGMNERANQIENAHARTFRWLFADADERKSPEPVWSSFTDWLQSNLSVYWIMGKPGSGKSTLSKFILSEPRTKGGLEKWRPGAVIASHYFWRPGSLMQRSIKGMLCSIAHQLLLSLPNSLEYSSTNISRIDQKDDATDWSVPELQQLCLNLTRDCEKPLCLFIDGLDECGPEDDHQKLLDTLESMRSPNVKIIVSSRNEPIFENRFRHEPQLRLQDLTADDLRNYAKDMLPYNIYSKILHELLENAEGVFLWLVLAVQSLNRGSRNGDSFEDLLRRVRSLPRDLNDLYKDMWTRLNDDSKVYRESAALYFKLAIAANDQTLNCLRQEWTPLEMMLASFEKNHDAFAKNPVISVSQLLKECGNFQKRVEVRCAGLLGLYEDPGLQSQVLQHDFSDTAKALLEYASNRTRFQFIHRSARDFLFETVEGQNIITHNEVSPEDINIRIISARLTAIELLHLILGDARELPFFYHSYEPFSTKVYLGDLSEIANAREGAARKLFFRCYEMCRSSILLPGLGEARPAYIAAFFGEAARYPKLTPHCASIIENELSGSDIRSAVLYVATSHLGYQTPKSVRWLLRLPDVDVNLKCPLVAPGLFQAWRGPDIIDPLGHIKESPFIRLLGSGLAQIRWDFDDFDDRPCSARYRFLGLVSEFASRGADVRDTLLLAIPLTSGIWDMECRMEGDPPPFLQFAGRDLAERSGRYHENYNGVICVVALQAKAVIQRMLASLPMTRTGHISIEEERYCPIEHYYSVSELQTGMQSLSQRCQEYSGGATDRVVGFLHPPRGMRDMPYRQVSDQDSARLLKIIWKCIFIENSPHTNALIAAFKEVVKRSPFSSIGFREYLIDRGCFDEPAARELLRGYGKYE